MNFSFYTIFGILGVLFIAYGIWVKKERRQDIILIIGGILLLVYSIYIEDIVFIILQAIYIISVTLEFIKLSKPKL